MKEQFGTIEKLNAAWQTNLAHFADITFPSTSTNATWHAFVT